MHRNVIALAALSLVVLTGCDQTQDELDNATAAAACKAVQQAVERVTAGVSDAVDSLGADPQAARSQLTQARTAVDAAADQVAGQLSAETKQALGEISGALATLAGEARDAASGAVDKDAVKNAQEEMKAAIGKLGEVC